ncbi:hypothetical protein QUF74_04485 [Candidatus Halobeggiatoa sp. HSG11]|nr:hypothetical protein [Candidatus Halobeggiatoa sp. HSG11]
MNLKPTSIIEIPLPLMKMIAKANDWLKIGTFNSDVLGMLLRDNCAEIATIWNHFNNSYKWMNYGHILQSKKHQLWVFAALDVPTNFWINFEVGSRTY